MPHVNNGWEWGEVVTRSETKRREWKSQLEAMYQGTRDMQISAESRGFRESLLLAMAHLERIEKP